jgi:hypothetical protein
MRHCANGVDWCADRQTDFGGHALSPAVPTEFPSWPAALQTRPPPNLTWGPYPSRLGCQGGPGVSGKTMPVCHSPGSADRVPTRRSRTRNNPRPSAAVACDRPCTRKSTGRRRSASSRASQHHTPGRSGSIQASGSRQALTYPTTSNAASITGPMSARISNPPNCAPCARFADVGAVGPPQHGRNREGHRSQNLESR